MAKVKYVSKSKLYPAFGDSDIKKQIAYVRKDLPKMVKIFVRDHELYHLKDLKEEDFTGGIWTVRFKGTWAEIKANFYSGIRHPLGFIMTIILSLQPYRIKLYIDRFRKGY